MANVKSSLQANLDLSKAAGFVDNMADEIANKKVQILRIHVSGDFYSANYLQKWIDIVDRSPNVRFFVYSRSWRIPDIYDKLKALARRSNVRLWLSADRDTGKPPKLRDARVAYMAVDDADIPTYQPDLVFRNTIKTVAKRVALALVCPKENGVTDTTCSKCGVCWR